MPRRVVSDYCSCRWPASSALASSAPCRVPKKLSWRAMLELTKSSCIRMADFETETKRLTGGAGVNVVYDSVGKTTFNQSLNVVRNMAGLQTGPEKLGRPAL